VLSLLVARTVLYIDLFKTAHKVRVGSAIRNMPTQLGAMVTLAFLWVALLVVVLLATQQNTTVNSELLPPTTTTLAGTARSTFQITMRAYAGSGDMQSWCRSDNLHLMSQQSGFVGGQFKLVNAKVSADGQSCDIAADCVNCGTAAHSALTFSFPYSAQLLEWELLLTGATPGQWGRRYGVIAQYPGQLLPTEAELVSNEAKIAGWVEALRPDCFLHSSDLPSSWTIMRSWMCFSSQ
jgi:hypothetical protein